ncbi:hypothetical protein [Asticcacaulis sp. EMRT-3]|uniref:hypothetical protein n=1 Tax=Asticcacaulis sp. EMRT-3 TaxID=3040349 RepID=UPI0024AF2BF5|nr:hypothetical protein [Asticcacaulis sp. EMRT-3]MDI7774294.1 hypothetical protein [Asticcacaulis sp. EMRT-3]
MRRLWMIAAVPVIVLGGCAGPMAPQDQMSRLSSDQCIFRPLRDTRVIDDQTLLLVGRSGRGALAHMASACLRVNEAVVLRYDGGASICGPLDVDVSGGMEMLGVGNANVPVHCYVKSLTPLSQDDASRMMKSGKS